MRYIFAFIIVLTSNISRATPPYIVTDESSGCMPLTYFQRLTLGLDKKFICLSSKFIDFHSAVLSGDYFSEQGSDLAFRDSIESIRVKRFVPEELKADLLFEIDTNWISEDLGYQQVSSASKERKNRVRVYGGTVSGYKSVGVMVD